MRRSGVAVAVNWDRSLVTGMSRGLSSGGTPLDCLVWDLEGGLVVELGRTGVVANLTVPFVCTPVVGRVSVPFIARLSKLDGTASGRAVRLKGSGSGTNSLLLLSGF